jgi:hypothetical protein
MSGKSDAEVCLEIYQSVVDSKSKQRRLKSSTFWHLFDVKKRRGTVVDKTKRLLDEQGLRVDVKSDKPLGEEHDDDWVILTLKLPIGEEAPQPPAITIKWPATEWFEVMQAREFESEREVESYFMSPLLEQLGYNYEDIVMGYPVEMYKGVQRTKTEADFVVFKGPGRDTGDVLLVVEAKKSDKGVTIDHIGQARSYAQALLPPCYVVSNGQQIKVYQFNSMLVPDECVMDIDRSEIKSRWEELYSHLSKEAAIKRKVWMAKQITKSRGSPTA